MFDLQIMVEDKNLHKVMWALDGLIVGAPKILPVRGAKAQKSPYGLTTIKTSKPGTLLSRLTTRILTHQGPCSYKSIVKYIEDEGGAPLGAGKMVQILMGRGVIKRISTGVYEATPQ